MNLLFAARTGVFEALTVGLGYLNQEDRLETSSVFGNMETEKTGELIYLGKSGDNDVYCVGNKYPDIVVRINEEINSLLGQTDSPLKVIPVSVAGSESVYLLSRLAMLPLAGSFFAARAKSKTLKIKDQLVSAGKNLRERNTAASRAAAKPFSPEQNSRE
ncbi:hypothetical protein [Syntrophomonas curvata]